jgi:alkylation response protein AidB-like acyl-CoA dehydrogenase
MATITDEVNSWLEQNWDTAMTVREWWGRLAAAGFSQPAWPVGRGGTGADSRTGRAIMEALAAHRTLAAPTGIGPNMGGPTLLEHGTEAQRQRLSALADGTEAWCQLFSEPDAGSDLAGLKTTARRDGDDFVVDGQKVWNSSADIADWGMLLARTDPTAAKHVGLTFFLIDMRQPGIVARPLRTMNGAAQFCEVFIDGARTSMDHVIGGLGNGWKVANTMLGHERRTAASGSPRSQVIAVAGGLGGQLDRRVGDVIAAARARTDDRPTAMINSAKTLIQLARESGASKHPVVRDQLARYFIQSEVYRLTNLRTRSLAASGCPPGAEASIGKIALSGLARTSRDLGVRIVGAGGMVTGPMSPSRGRVQHAAVSSAGVSLGGGTDEIQRNVIGERVLGLPRE